MYLTAVIFSLFAALAVILCSRGGRDCDPRVTGTALILLLIFPLFAFLPKWEILPVPTSGGLSAPSLSVLPIIGFTITLLLSSRLGLSAIRLSQWLRKSELVGTLNVGGKSVALRKLDGIKSPCATGILRPVIFLPTSWDNWPESLREMVLKHEVTHHERRDPLWRFMASIACALHWFNPLSWWLARRHALQSEYACDSAVVASGHDAAAYSHALCDMAEGGANPLTAGMSERALDRRVRQLMTPSPMKNRPAWLAVVCLVALALTMSVCRHAETELEKQTDSTEVEIRLSADPFPAN